MLSLFFPRKHRENLSIDYIKRVPILVYTNLILLLYFLVAAYSRYKADPVGAKAFLNAVLATLTLFPVSLILVRLKLYLPASVASMLGIFLNTAWIGLLLPLSGYTDLYRFSVYIIASSTTNLLLSFRKSQTWAYSISCLLLFISVALLFYAPKLGGFQGEFKNAFTTLTMLYIAVTYVFYLINKLSSDLIVIANNEMKKNKDKADSLNDLISNAKESLKIGSNLVDYSEKSTQSSTEIRTELVSIADSAQKLSSDASCADTTNKEIVNFSKKMQAAVDNQNSFLQETSSAVTEIMTTIQNIALLAEQKKSIMNSVVNKIESQGREIQKLTEGFEAIQESSHSVLSVISSILDISEKTNMLAMNASIEAAHAGAAGKGFAVISGEIRKLSQETQVSTQSISEALSKNQEVIDLASDLIHRYTISLRDVIEDVRDTFNSFEEIIAGLSEINIGAKELTEATGNMVSISIDTRETIKSVAVQITDSSASLEHISTFSCALDERIVKLKNDFVRIESIIKEIKDIGHLNIEQIRRLEADLDGIMRN